MSSTGTATLVSVAPLLGEPAAARLVAAAQRFGAYRLYAEHERFDVPYGRGLLPRHDAVVNFLRTRAEPGEDPVAVSARTSYFREEYAYGEDRDLLDGVEVLRDHEGFADAARAIHGLDVIEPAIVYANLMLPGQELAVHTDVPEFRGMNRKLVPQWLLVVMHHAGLFEPWRLPIATAIAYFGDVPGGELVVWPDGPDGAEAHVDPTHDTAVVLDTDTVFHGVDPVGTGERVDHLPLGLGTRLVGEGDDWRLVDADDREHARYRWDGLRFSVSWKAYCFADEADRTRWRDHTEDTDVAQVLARLVEDLRDRGHDTAVDDPGLGTLLIEEYVRFPTPPARTHRTGGRNTVSGA